MNSSTKKLFKRYRGYYKQGCLEEQFLEQVRRASLKCNENPDDVLGSWHDFCVAEFGVVEQADPKEA